MKRISILLAILTASGLSLGRDTISDYSIQEALVNPKVYNAVGNEVSFYFGDQKPFKVVKNFGEFRTNKKTNGFNKSDTFACQWAFAGALKSLKARALREGGNAVINIRSNYRDNITSSDSFFKCGSGALISGVALIGDVVKIVE